MAWTSLPGIPPSPPGNPLGQQNANVFSTERGYDPGNPINIYGFLKAMGEQVVRDLAAESGAICRIGGTRKAAAANASDQNSLNTLLNELKTKINAHMADAPSGKLLRAVSA